VKAEIFHLVAKKNDAGSLFSGGSCSMLVDYLEEVSFCEYADERSVFDDRYGP
jgi:hypothetical protein